MGRDSSLGGPGANSSTPGNAKTTSYAKSPHTSALERELAQLERINSTIGQLISTIKTTHTNIDLMNESSNNTRILLDQWIRILSQTNFTHELINDGWSGETADVSEVAEEERILKEELKSIEDANETLSRQIEQKEREKADVDTKLEEQTARRRRELGLFPSRTKRPRV